MPFWDEVEYKGIKLYQDETDNLSTKVADHPDNLTGYWTWKYLIDKQKYEKRNPGEEFSDFRLWKWGQVPRRLQKERKPVKIGVKKELEKFRSLSKKSSVKKTPVRKSSVKKTPVRKSSVKKTPVRKSSVKKTPVRKSSVKKTPKQKRCPNGSRKNKEGICIPK